MSKDVINENIRLLILRILHDMAGMTANESIIDDSLDAWGVSISRDLVCSHLSWLEEQGLITLREVYDCKVAMLTGRGEDVATGQTRVPGVKRPRAK